MFDYPVTVQLKGDGEEHMRKFVMGEWASPVKSNGIIFSFEKVYDIIFDNLGSKLSAVEDEEERHRIVMDIVYNLEVSAEERAKELLAPLELEM